MSSFDKNVTYTYKGKIHTYACKKGLWSASSKEISSLRDEALRCFRQYESGGEYDGTVLEKLMKLKK